jgi:hypothetical protein
MGKTIYYFLLAIIPQIHTLLQKAKEVYGSGTEVMPILVIVLVFSTLVFYYWIKKGWLK